jgi:hypothetical protein
MRDVSRQKSEVDLLLEIAKKAASNWHDLFCIRYISHNKSGYCKRASTV